MYIMPLYIAYCHSFPATSIVGTIGFCTSICRRLGIALSAWSAACIAFFYMFVIIALLADPDTCFNYLTANQSVLYLNDASIAMIRMWLPAIYIACACLAVVETCRFFVLRKLRNTLLRYDAAQRSITERSKQQQDSNRTILTAPLLEDDQSWVVLVLWICFFLVLRSASNVVDLS